MLRRLSLVLLIPCALAACNDNALGKGAARAVIDWNGFSPGCLKLTATGGAGHSATSTLPLGDKARQGSKTIAVFRAEGWDSKVLLTAQALEGGCADGKVVAEKTETVAITSGVVESAFSLTAKDEDSDGFVDAMQADLPGSDCNDTNAEIHPGVSETCNGIDENCDGNIDEGVLNQYFEDADGDGHGNYQKTANACTQPDGYVINQDDCDDAHDTVYPGATEACDGFDNDCNGQIDDGLPQQSWFVDADGDTYGSKQTVTACVQPPNSSENDTDCDDGVASVHPGATEVCNGVDDDCDGTPDDGVTQTYFVDADGDGYGDNSKTQQACTLTPGYAAQGGDCNDSDKDMAPGWAEVCDGKDNNCDKKIDEGVTTTFYADADQDGAGDPLSPLQACSAPTGAVANADDCDDADAQKAPGLTEICDGKDNNCDSATDEGVTTTFYADGDQDTFGDPASAIQACSAPTGYVVDNTDCDDARGTVHPGASEVCDELDNNCNGTVDEGVTQTFYVDADLDGYGDPTATVQACAAGAGAVTDNTDCDDTTWYSNPGATEACDGIDNDCDGTVDGACPVSPWYNVSTGGGHHLWRKIAPTSAGAWVVGGDNGGKLRFVPGNNTTALSFDGDCGSANWYSATANYLTGRLYAGGETGGIGVHDSASGSACAGTSTFGSTKLAGQTLFLDGAGSPVLEGVTAGGIVYKWDLSTTAPSQVANVPSTIFDAYIGTESYGYAVGSTLVGQNKMPFIMHATSATTWAADTLPAGLPANKELRSVSMTFGGFAAAVGDGCVVLFRDPKGTGWTAPATSPSDCKDLRGVVVFGKNLVYVVGDRSSSGYALWKWNGTSWAEDTNVSVGQVPRDIRGASPSDFWIAGAAGMVLHYSP